MSKFSKNDIFQKLYWGLNRAGIIYLILDEQHPLHLSIIKDDTSIEVLVYAWNITHGGKSRPEDEYRIQATGIRNKFATKDKCYTIILGYYDKMGVFAAFDHTFHADKVGVSPSLQVKEEFLSEASMEGFSYCKKSNGEVVYTFKPEYFVTYLQLLEDKYEAPLVYEENKAIIEAARANTEEDAIKLVPLIRKEKVITVRKAYRKYSFREQVLEAYNRTCSFCGVQLELIEAAHIVPVFDSRSNDEVNNGIALCCNHHRAFDQGFLYINNDYKIKVNRKRMDYLARSDLVGGKDEFLNLLREMVILPCNGSLRPAKEYLSIARELRDIK